MPSPVGHALGGIAAGWRVAPETRLRAAAVLAAVAIAPDLDLLVGDHRGISHSIGAAILAGLAAWVIAWTVSRASIRRHALRWALAVMLAWTSHIALDWLSDDTRPPIGVMALWPMSHASYKAPIELFPPVSRHYWEARFWVYNAKALVVEVVILGPVALLVARGRRRSRRGAASATKL